MKTCLTWTAAALLVVSASAHAQDAGVAFQIDPSGNIGVGTATPSQRLDVRGNAVVTGAFLGQSKLGGQAATIKGFGTGNKTADISFKYDAAKFGDTEKAIQIWNTATGVFKTFIIDHPTDPSRYLVHATLEGPEGAVFYRGTARLVNGRAEVQLPPYFEALTHPTDRTVILTNIDGFDRLAVEKQPGGKIADGRFVVVSDNPASGQEFDWEVKAVRKDGPRLVDAPRRSDLSVAGLGPYTFAFSR